MQHKLPILLSVYSINRKIMVVIGKGVCGCVCVCVWMCVCVCVYVCVCVRAIVVLTDR